MLDDLRVAPQTSPRLAERDPGEVPGVKLQKKDAEVELDTRIEQLELLQQRLYAEDDRSLLVVLQGMDTSGKDGAIKHVFRGITPSGTRVAAFKAPSESELAHDFLWRVHSQCPPRGQIGIFNRSHYEDVVAARVRGGLPIDRVRQRYDHIRDFERMLADEGTTVVKCFLHISKDEQRERLRARLADPEKRWKLRAGDLDDRARWDEFEQAYEEAITATSTDVAPWYVVPANRKWLRSIVVAEIVVRALEAMDPQLPPEDPDLDEVVIST